MSAPLVHIFSVDLKEGQLAGYRAYIEEHARFVEKTHPDLLAFHVYLSQDGKRVSAVQVHPDAASLDLFMKEVVPVHGVKAYEFVEQGTETSDVFGVTSDAARDQIVQFGVDLRYRPTHLSGFTRL